jgi:hypothetical protein
VRLSSETGLKLYITREERDACFVLQSIGAENSIAPQVGECLEIDGLKIPEDEAPKWWKYSNRSETPKRLYGYLTEVIETKVINDKAAVDWLCVGVEAIGMRPVDMWDGHNMGRLRDGRPVVFDWDPRTVPGIFTNDEIRAIEDQFSDYFF